MVAADIMFVKNIPFVSIGFRGVTFTTVEYVSQSLMTVLAKYILKIFQFDTNNGYNILMLWMNRELDWICDSLPEEVKLNTTLKIRMCQRSNLRTVISRIMSEHWSELFCSRISQAKLSLSWYSLCWSWSTRSNHTIGHKMFTPHATLPQAAILHMTSTAS